MPNTKVLVNFIQDRSGSMGTVWQETLSGFKSFIEDLQSKGKTDGVDYLFSLTTFDTLVECPFIGEPIENMQSDVLVKYGPRGSTALYDAVGKTIENTAADLKGADKIICVIVTDGQENSSREWSKDALNAVIAAKLDLGNWTFTYLGTQPETWDDAQSLGIGVGAVAGYQGQNARATYGAVAGAVHAMAASPSAQSRGLFTSGHASPRTMRAAGMQVRTPASPMDRINPILPPNSKPPSTVKPKARKPTRATDKRWR